MSLSEGISTTYNIQSLQHWHITHCNHSRDTVLELQSLVCLLPLEFTLGSSNTAFNYMSDCSVQCMNRTRKPQPSLTTVTRAVTSTTMTENDIVKLIMMLLPLQNRTEKALCNRPMYISCTYSTVRTEGITEIWIEAKGKLKWEMEKRWGKLLTVDGQVL